MKNYRQILISVFMIFATAYLLTILGCSKSTDVSGKPPAGQAVPGNELESTDQPELQPLQPDQVRECTVDEFAGLQDWSIDLDLAKKAITNSGGQKNQTIIKLALAAIEKCDRAQFYHSQKPCKKITRTIVDPNNSKVKVYDAYSIHLRCEPVDTYLKKYNLRPDPNPTLPPGQLSQCSADEFSKLKAWRTSLDSANKNISKLGNQSNWKFDAAALESSKNATALCESLITYHQTRPCQREKTYTAQSLREQCASARTYFYNFAQRTESLIVPNARLYLNSSIFSKHAEFNPGFSNLSFGQCVLTNITNSVITYEGQQALVTEARVSTDPAEQMFVMQTQEGLKFECYGLEYSSAATSLTEVLLLLSAKETKLSLSYELN